MYLKETENGGKKILLANSDLVFQNKSNESNLNKIQELRFYIPISNADSKTLSSFYYQNEVGAFSNRKKIVAEIPNKYEGISRKQRKIEAESSPIFQDIEDCYQGDFWRNKNESNITEHNILSGKSQNIILNCSNIKESNTNFRKTVKDNNLKNFTTKMSFYKTKKGDGIIKNLSFQPSIANLNEEISPKMEVPNIYFELNDRKLKAFTEK
ncbi:unnamed protein product [Moneuplotes crassus]|uniref:Uncharacterized protein n=1 Tax=Euplotes crassus TaxID=5936 RepID=A0AAD2DB29_EUPCR|nr:unnamed protein product [Moneuplotes crassus]